MPPYSYSKKTHLFDVPERSGKIEGLIGIIDFIRKSKCEYIIISDANVVVNIDLEKVVEFHKEKESDVTCVCVPNVSKNEHDTFFQVDRYKNIQDVSVSIDIKDTCTHTGLGIYVIGKQLLIDSLTYWASHNYKNFEIEGLNQMIKEHKLKAYVHNNFAAKITDVKRYFDSNMSLLSKDIREEIFVKNRAILTKVYDEQPTYYGDKSNVNDSLIADGCTLEGNVENSIIFRDVHVNKGATVKNCIVLQGAIIEQDASISHVITDKDVQIGNSKTTMNRNVRHS